MEIICSVIFFKFYLRNSMCVPQCGAFLQLEYCAGMPSGVGIFNMFVRVHILLWLFYMPILAI